MVIRPDQIGLVTLLSLIFLVNSISSSGQSSYSIRTVSRTADSSVMLHSFSYGRIGDTLIVFGGRKDGMHGKEDGFENTGRNDRMVLYDLRRNSSKTYSLATLAPELQDALSSSSSAFAQDDSFLYILGGYGQDKNGDYRTFPSLIRVNLQSLLGNITGGGPILSAFSQSFNDTFAVAGAQMKKIGDDFYLVGGHRFDGRYGQDSRKYRQQYTERSLVFRFADRGGKPVMEVSAVLIDELNFHRRDFNLAPFFTSSNVMEPTAFAGVFMVNDARPFRNISSIQKDGFTDIRDFSQNLANYQCAHIGLYDSTNDVMREIFFGGMAEYYYNGRGELTRDPLVPFVKTISCVERDHEGNFREFAFLDALEEFTGCNAEFICHKDVRMACSEIIDLGGITADTALIGHVIGGILNTSARLHPWQDSITEMTMANPYILDVFLVRQNAAGSKEVRADIYRLSLTCTPNPAQDRIRLDLEREVREFRFWLVDASGRIRMSEKHHNLSELTVSTKQIASGNYRLCYMIDGSQYGSISLTIKAE